MLGIKYVPRFTSSGENTPLTDYLGTAGLTDSKAKPGGGGVATKLRAIKRKGRADRNKLALIACPANPDKPPETTSVGHNPLGRVSKLGPYPAIAGC